jgi:Holliday junction resolvase
MSECSLQTNVIKYLRSVGAYAINIHGDEFQAGVPDVIACYKGRFLGLELKAPNGQLSKLQKRNLQKIQKAGGIAEEVRSLEKVRTIIKAIDNDS